MSERNGNEEQGRDIVITVVNEENGEEFALHAGKGTPIATLIKRVYEKVGVVRQQDDRLRCEGGGEDVFAYGEMHLGDYLEEGHCTDRVWLFAGGTGGALC